MGRFGARLGLIVLGALVLRVVYALALAGHDNVPIPGGDRFFFVESAKLVASGHGFVQPFAWLHFHQSAASAAHPPLWIITLALPASLGIKGYVAARLIGALAGAAAVAAIGLIGRKVGGAYVGLMAAGIAAVYPAFVSGDTSGMSEVLYLLLVALTVLAVLVARDQPRVRAAALAGVLAGLAALTRTEGLLLLPFVAWPALWGRGTSRPWLLPVVCTLGVALTLTPWSVRNWIAFDRPIPISTNEASVIAGANCRQTYYGVDKGSWSAACLYAATPPNPGHYDEGLRAASWRAEGLHYASHHLDRLLPVAAVRVLRTWHLWQPLHSWSLTEGENRWATKIAAIVFWLLLPAGVLGAAWGGLRRDHLLILAALAVMVTTTSAVGWGSPRFLRPAELALLVCAAAGVAARRRRHGREL